MDTSLIVEQSLSIIVCLHFDGDNGKGNTFNVNIVVGFELQFTDRLNEYERSSKQTTKGKPTEKERAGTEKFVKKNKIRLEGLRKLSRSHSSPHGTCHRFTAQPGKNNNNNR